MGTPYSLEVLHKARQQLVRDVELVERDIRYFYTLTDHQRHGIDFLREELTRQAKKLDEIIVAIKILEKRY